MVTYHSIEFTDVGSLVLAGCTCGWQSKPWPDHKMSAEAWAEHWAEVFVLPRYRSNCERIAKGKGLRSGVPTGQWSAEFPPWLEVEVLFGVEWAIDDTEYWESPDVAREIFDSIKTDVGAKLVKITRIKEYIEDLL